MDNINGSVVDNVKLVHESYKTLFEALRIGVIGMADGKRKIKVDDVLRLIAASERGALDGILKAIEKDGEVNVSEMVSLYVR